MDTDATPPPDARLAAIARRQFGAFSWGQSRACGVPDGTIGARLAAGRYRQLLTGVLAESATPDSWEARAMAALLAVGGDATLARGSAARLHGLSLGSGAPVAVLVRTRTFRGLDDIRIHRTRVLEADDVTTLGPLTVTTVARTLCDLAGHASDDDLRKAVAMAVRRRWTDATQLRVMARRLGRFRGRRRLMALLDELHPLDGDCRSELETRFLRLMVGARLPPTAMNHPVVDARGRRRVLDAAYLPQRVPVELDSRLAHGTLLDWHDDLRRENDVVLTGWRSFLRFSWDDVVHQPDRVVGSVRQALEAADADRVCP